MSRVEEARRQAEMRLAESRREAEERLAEVRAAVETEFGIVPKKAYWALALLAGAGGFALAFSGFRQKRRKKKTLRT